MKKAIFIGATGQNVGKTTLCLGIMSLLRKRFQRVGFIKPVGQIHVKVNEDLFVDKDVFLFKDHFHLQADYAKMSPVIFPSGFTRDYLDGKVNESDLCRKIVSSYEQISKENDFTLVEGTGHLGVGSIVNLNNAKVASLLNLDVIIVVMGGLGNAHDELALNLSLCEQYGVKVRGVILNRVLPEKKAMIENYFPKALKHWNIPLLGCVPYNPFLIAPTMQDFESLFKTKLIAGEGYHHFTSSRLVAGSVEAYQMESPSNELIITPATRSDIVEITLERYRKHRKVEGSNWIVGLILTGAHKPHPKIIEHMKREGIPSLYVSMHSYEALKTISSFTAKIQGDDLQKIEQAKKLVEESINIDCLF